MASLFELMRGRTTLMIAHRITTIRRVDKILVVEERKPDRDGCPRGPARRAGLLRASGQRPARLVRGRRRPQCRVALRRRRGPIARPARARRLRALAVPRWRSQQGPLALPPRPHAFPRRSSPQTRSWPSCPQPPTATRVGAGSRRSRLSSSGSRSRARGCSTGPPKTSRSFLRSVPSAPHSIRTMARYSPCSRESSPRALASLDALPRGIGQARAPSAALRQGRADPADPIPCDPVRARLLARRTPALPGLDLGDPPGLSLELARRRRSRMLSHSPAGRSGHCDQRQPEGQRPGRGGVASRPAR